MLRNLEHKNYCLPKLLCSSTLLCLFCGSLLGESRSGFIGEVAVLYWRAFENGVAPALDVDKSPQGQSSVVELPFEWDFGFRIGVGYHIPHDHWEGVLEWTSLQTHTDLTKDSCLLPIWSTYYQNTPLTVGNVKAHWRLHFGMIDALVRKNFSPASSIVLTPELGIGVGSIRQKYNIEYQGGRSFPEGGTLIRMKNKFWGIGPYCGLSGRWTWKGGVSLYGRGIWRLLCGSFYLHQDEDLIQGWQKILGIHHIYSQSSSLLQGGLGLLWTHGFSKGFKQIELCCAWDQLILFSQNQLMRFVEKKALGNFVANLGDITLAGVEFSCRLDF